MELPSKPVYEVLAAAGVESIYHANSVITSCQFLRNRALLSRGTVERRGLYQTAQGSDDIDKRFGIWFDVFTDSVDIHDRAKRANLYGPALFVLDSELIAKVYSIAYGALKLSMTEGELDIPISKRTCPDGCRCLDDYRDAIERTTTMFVPKV